MNADIDLLLVLCSSLLKGDNVEERVILEALVESDGDPEAAARLINSQASCSTTNKRKRPVGLQEWLKKPPSKSTKPKSTSTPRPASSNKPKTTVSSISKPTVDLMSVLRQAPSNPQTVPRPVPLTLSTSALVAKHTPCTYHPSILPAELACDLFYTMLEQSKEWSRNEWWLFDRLVESPHRTSFYAREGVQGQEPESWAEAAQYWYNGRKTGTPQVFPPAMEKACSIIEDVVNAEMRKRKRYPQEWGGRPDEKDGKIWRANVAASNCYEGGKESVGAHSDQVTYLGPYPTIASLSLGTRRVFRLQEVIPNDEKDTRKSRTFNIPLAHNSLVIMHAGTQEKYKHSIPPQTVIDLFKPAFPPLNAVEQPQEDLDGNYPGSNCRINITFRFYRPDFRPSLTPRCKCGIPCILRPDMKGRVGITAQSEEKQTEEGLRQVQEETMKYWWTCHAGAQTEEEGCGMWMVMDMEKEGRGPIVGDLHKPRGREVTPGGFDRGG